MIENPNNTLGRDVASKLEFYMIGLVFTLLAASIQMTQITEYGYQFIFVYASWVLFLVSGLSGLYRIDNATAGYKSTAYIQELEKQIEDNKSALVNPVGIVDKNMKTISRESVEAAITRSETLLLKEKPILKKRNENHVISYRVHKYCFVLGLLIIIVAKILYSLEDMDIV